MPNAMKNRSGLWSVFVLILLVFSVSVLAQDDPPTPAETSTATPTLTETLLPSTTPSPTLVPSATPLPGETATAQPSATSIEESATDTPAAESTQEPTASAEDTVVPTEDVAVTASPTLAEISPVPPTAAAPEPAMQVLAYDSFDNGDLSNWQMSSAWSLINAESGLALQVLNSRDPIRYGQGLFYYYNVAVQMRVALSAAPARLTLRQNSAGGYSAILYPNGDVQLLRGEQLLAAATAPVIGESSWRTLRLSAIDSTLRIAVDNTELLVIEDPAALPPGDIVVSADMPLDAETGLYAGGLVIDDFTLLVPQAEFEFYPTATPATIAEPTLPPNTIAPPTEVTESGDVALVEATEDLSVEIKAAVAEATAEASPALLIDPDTGKALTTIPQPAEPGLFAQAVNDDFASALALLSTFPGNTASDNTSATSLEASETLPSGCGYDVGNTVWHSFVPPEDGHYTFNLAGSDFDTVLAVYTGSTVDALTQIGCNDDASTRILSSELLLRNLSSATTYWIQIGGYRQDYGQYQIAVEQYGVRRLSAPRLSNPTSGHSLVDQTPLFEWNPVTNAFAYEFQISTDSRFRTLDIDPAPVLFTTDFVPSLDLPPGRYYWRVASLNANGTRGSFSRAAYVNIRLDGPTPTSPSAGSVQATVQPTFRLSSFGSGASYEIQLSNTDDFDSDLDHSFECTRTSCRLSDYSLHQGDWFWRVRAIDSQGNPTAFSESLGFVVDLQYRPLDGYVYRTTSTGSISFSWRAASDATGWALQYDDDPSFGSPEEVLLPLSSRSYRATGLAYDNYYWRLLAIGLDDGHPELVPTRSFTVSPRNPARPALLNPANSAYVADQTPFFDWADSPEPNVSYDLEICTRSSCRPETSIIETVTGLTASEYTTTTVLETEDDGDRVLYYWRVTAVNEFGVAGSTAVYRMYVRTLPPQPYSPRHESSTTDDTPNLYWRSFSGATYNLQVASDDAFSNILISETNLTSTRFTVETPLPPGSYFWRVQALDSTVDATPTAFSDAFKLTIGPRPPSAPRLLSPSHGWTIADTSPSFDWDDVADVDSYCFQLDDDRRFASPEIDDCGLVVSDLTAASDLAPGRYYWRSRAVNALGGAGSFSSARYVTIQTDGPTPRSPRDEYVTRDTTPALVWTSYSRASSYNIRVDDDPACDSSIEDFSSTTNRITLPLLDQGTYYWCVQAIDYLNNAESATEFGPVSSFTVNIMTSPSDGTISRDTTPAFRWASAGSGALYCLDIDDAADFADPLVQSECGLTGSSLSLATELPFGVYYWRIRVSMDAGSSYHPDAPPYRMLTINPEVPGRPVLSLPRNRSVIWTDSPSLHWRPVTSGDPVEYLVEISESSRFTDIAFTEIFPATNCSADECSLMVNPALALDTTYYWRVYARNERDVTSRASSTYRFSLAAPTVPTLRTPLNDSTTTRNRPGFRWRGPSGSVSYEIRLDTMNPPLASFTSSRAAYTPPAPLLVTTYYWQVQAYDSIGTPSGWSEIWLLKIDTSYSTAPTPNRFDNGAPVLLTWGPVSWAETGGWYEVMVDDQTNFRSPIYASPLDDSLLPGGVLEVGEGSGDFPVLVNGTYYWRVRACDSSGTCGRWGRRNSFIVDRN